MFGSVSMENITTDMHELEKGMELTKREYAARKDSRDCPVILKDFLANAEDRFKKLLADVKTAQVRELAAKCDVRMCRWVRQLVAVVLCRSYTGVKTCCCRSNMMPEVHR